MKDLTPMGTVTLKRFEELFGDWYPQVRHWAYTKAGDSRHMVDPSFEALEALIKAAIHREQLQGTTDVELAGWLKRIVVNGVKDRLRRMEARNLSLESLPGTHHSSGAESDPLVQAQRRDEIHKLLRAIDQLDEAEREIVYLYHLSDIPRPALAEMFGLNESALKKRAQRARQRLNCLMGETP